MVEFCEWGNELKVPYNAEKYWQAGDLLVSQEGLCPLELVYSCSYGMLLNLFAELAVCMGAC
jgi:hypothetical protein